MTVSAVVASLGEWMSMGVSPEIQAAIDGFQETILRGVPILLAQNATAFLSFMCSVSAIDALAAYRYPTDDVGQRFRDFILGYFPQGYAPHAANLYVFRCRLLHNFSPAYFTLLHAQQQRHLHPSEIGDYYLSDQAFYSDLQNAATAFFGEVLAQPERQLHMQARLDNVNRGGAIYIVR